jgi:peptidoglycan hydrolase-like protein with peptidoglycan-binding domain
LRDDAPVRNDEETPPATTPGDIFSGTPYQTASPETQRRVIMNAQNLLARRGYLRTAIDGEFGADTEFALRAFQARFNLRSTGRLDRETLAALGLMPGQRAPGVTAGGVAPPRHRVYRRVPQDMTRDGEPIYEGR